MVDCSFSSDTLPWWGLMAAAGAALARDRTGPKGAAADVGLPPPLVPLVDTARCQLVGPPLRTILEPSRAKKKPVPTHVFETVFEKNLWWGERSGFPLPHVRLLPKNRGCPLATFC